MNKYIGGLLVSALALSTSSAFAADALTLQLKWVTQAQFAGYLVAESKGFYDEENLDITILPGGPNVAPEQVIAGGGAIHIQRPQDQFNAGLDRGDCRGVLRDPHCGNGLPDFNRGR